MRKFIYCMIDIETNSYDYDNPAECTDDIEQAYSWIENGCEQVAILDACDLSYLGYMDIEDLYRHRNYDEEIY